MDNYTTQFLKQSRTTLKHHEFLLLHDIISEWNLDCPISETISRWQKEKTAPTMNPQTQLQIISFNVRGYDSRWGEVCMLSRTYQADIIILCEVGHLDFSLLQASFSEHHISYQKGENPHGGVLILVRKGIVSTRIDCDIPNICVVDIYMEQTYRLIAVYAPASKSWNWSVLSQLITTQCMLIGDFNVDLEKDGEKADNLLEWMDGHMLAPFLPDTNTSLRSNRIIDYALAVGLHLSIQTYEGPTSSDHKPLVGLLSVDESSTCEGFRTIWPVFSLVLSYGAKFWEQRWSKDHYDQVYEEFVTFLALLELRCRHYFPMKRARLSVPVEIVTLLAQSRKLSYKAKRKGDIMLRREARNLRNQARYELKRYQQEQLARSLKTRNIPGEGSTIFWSKVKRQFKPVSSTLRGFTLINGEITKNAKEMVNIAADHYEKLFKAPVVMRPHPYVDSPPVQWENNAEVIPTVTYPELLSVLRTRKKKQSKDIHGLSPFLLDKIPRNYWHMLVRLYNYSFTNGQIPKKLKEVRIILLAKKTAICPVDQTRPISLLDSFLKIQEKLFMNRFTQILKNRGILPDNQSGFRAGFRLQTRVLLLIDQIASYMSNSSPVATVFVDFKSAFDQLWFEGCLGKLARMGIPRDYIAWIKCWLIDRRAVIEVDGCRSRWINIQRGGPQGSVFTPTLFITYHADMAEFLPRAMSFFFADDLAAVIAGQMGLKFSDQCLDLEKRLREFFTQLEFYSILACQPINYAKTQTMFSARAVRYPNPLPEISCGGHRIEWTSSFKYLGYWLTTKLGWSNIISKTKIKTRQRTSLVNSFRCSGVSSIALRRTLFLTFVLPYFTWLFAVFPLFTETQREDLNHLYLHLLKRIRLCQYWQDNFFMAYHGERSLHDRCYSYWEKYLKKLSKLRDGYLLIEQLEVNRHRSRWRDGKLRIQCLYRSKRFVQYMDPLSKALSWLAHHGTANSIIEIPVEDLVTFKLFPESFN